MRSKGRWIVLGMIAAYSGEILLHRWAWHQIPTQLPASVVYGTLFVNLGIVLALRRIP